MPRTSRKRPDLIQLRLPVDIAEAIRLRAATTEVQQLARVRGVGPLAYVVTRAVEEYLERHVRGPS